MHGGIALSADEERILYRVVIRVGKASVTALRSGATITVSALSGATMNP
jgi:hypothetical protein